MKQKGTRPPIFRSLAWRFSALTLALWIACMSILTWCVASDMLQQMRGQIRLYLNSNVSVSREGDDDTLPGSVELNMIQRLGYPYYIIDLDPLLPIVGKQHLQKKFNSDDWLWGKWELQYGHESALSYYAEDGEALIRTGDYLTFQYTTEENWFRSDTAAVGKAYVALDSHPELADSMLTSWPIGDMAADLIHPVLRLTGYFEGAAFHPTSIDSGLFLDPNSGMVDDISLLCALDGRKQVQWRNLLTVPAEESTPQETIYAWDAGGFNCPQKQVKVNGKTFATLSDLLHYDRTCEDPGAYSRYSLTESVLIESRRYEDAHGIYTLAIAVRCKPLQYAALRLIWVYLVTLGIIALWLWLLLRRLRHHFARPMERMVLCARSGTALTPSAKYREVNELETWFSETLRTLSDNKTQLQQLRAALDYAQDAEERRKQLISNITHELKTPLAILHSYCESLLEDVPREAQAQYLQTILEETEKMDGMVVQMLELSRLEAGKIRLSSDQFSLLELTNRLLMRMQPLLEQRGLTVCYGYTKDFTLTADEARMEQVITNLLSNAQKYATQGGMIRIRTYLMQGSAYFYIENTAPHLTGEALEKVYDSFYRADASRSTPGTGLGLALVKSIISLHAGTCSVRNTTMDDGSEAVEFGFCLPLK